MTRRAISKSLDLFKVPSALIRLIQLTLSNTKAKVKINNDFTEQIEINSGVRQGNSLSVTLLCSVIDMIMRKLDLKCNITIRSKQIVIRQMAS